MFVRVVQCRRCRLVELATVEWAAIMESSHSIRSLTNAAVCYVHRTWNDSTSTFVNVVVISVKTITY